jgi:hypothetical protein
MNQTLPHDDNHSHKQNLPATPNQNINSSILEQLALNKKTF